VEAVVITEMKVIISWRTQVLCLHI